MGASALYDGAHRSAVDVLDAAIVDRRRAGDAVVVLLAAVADGDGHGRAAEPNALVASVVDGRAERSAAGSEGLDAAIDRRTERYTVNGLQTTIEGCSACRTACIDILDTVDFDVVPTALPPISTN